ncbi:MAG: SixA phosphatase family protein [Candidatus Dormibacteraceae bacterium]
MATVVVVRHGKAGHREGWTGDDRERPLTRKGRRQAEGLVTLLAPFAFSGLRTSPYVRCRETLEPLARARGLPLVLEEDLAEGGRLDPLLSAAGRDDPDGCWAACTHGDLLGDLLYRLVATGVLPEAQVALEKGGSWVLEVGSSGVVDARYLAPPEG